VEGGIGTADGRNLARFRREKNSDKNREPLGEQSGGGRTMRNSLEHVNRTDPREELNRSSLGNPTEGQPSGPQNTFLAAWRTLGSGEKKKRRVPQYHILGARSPPRLEGLCKRCGGGADLCMRLLGDPKEVCLKKTYNPKFRNGSGGWKGQQKTGVRIFESPVLPVNKSLI